MKVTDGGLFGGVGCMSDETNLESICVVKGLQTGPFGSQLKAEEYTADGVPVVMPRDIVSGQINTRLIARVSDSKASSLSKHRLISGENAGKR